jgi:EpsI family protein
MRAVVISLPPTNQRFMSTYRTSLIVAILMCATSLVAVVARPSVKAAEAGPKVVLETMVPKQFGDWREEPQAVAQVINPETKELLDKLYSQILTRTYVSADGYRIMLSLAYGNDQRGELQAHKPEICYPAQGFTLHANEAGLLATVFGGIPVHRLTTSMGDRKEPVTYWFTEGDRAIEGALYKRLVEIRYGLTGLIPDGMLFRVSSIDPDRDRAFQQHQRFVDQLLGAVSADDRKRLSGLAGG